MNSPPNPGSPASSTSSLTDRESDEFVGSASIQQPSASQSSGPMAAKRRPAQGTPSKARRLERERPQRGPGSSALGSIDATGGSSAAARAKEELVDSEVLEYFKKEFGDPFDDSLLKTHA
ncbi:hypothetical protein AURDEDRAFT_175473 [Auricularia subglabra TFB-10046 SS5]|uniref:Uncharacterized protein n=1 Tax=Auricularia subglabra (strain TFB-10046 / SS5) TaxID=717982 RepID=J0CXH0_AURST|nr:hypothetical protein AURDEDRAFT_175473 [Auricularia subglabra TFB-10046 SS5]